MNAGTFSRINWTLCIVVALAILSSGAWAQTPAPGAPPAPAAGDENKASQQSPANPPAPAGADDPSQPSAPSQPPVVQAPQEPSAQAPGANDQGSMFVFKKQVEEVVLHATVVDQQQRLVSDLDRGAFTVMERGTPQTITSFRREDVPVAMGILVDNSGSMRDKREKVNQAVLNLIRASNPQDEIFVVNFSQNFYLDQDFTSDVNLLQAALHQSAARGSTALYDAIVASATHLESNRRLEKKVLLVITDGQDNMSQQTLQEAARRLQKQADCPTIYAVGLLGGDMQKQGREALQYLSARTGGVAYFPATIDDVDGITRTVAHDIRSQYRIAYKPQNSNADPGFQSIRLEAHAQGYGQLTVRTKSGYYSPDAPR